MRARKLWAVLQVGAMLVDPWLDENPSNLRIPTLGDLYDRARGNRPVVGMTATVNWHLGMIGHGADFRGGIATRPL